MKLISRCLLKLRLFTHSLKPYILRLNSIRTKDAWEEWIKFFLKGVASVADEATTTAKEILSLRGKYKDILMHSRNTNSLKFLDELFISPVVSKKATANLLNVAYPTASTLINEFEELKILVKIDKNRRRNNSFVFQEYMNRLERGTEL